MLSYQTVNSHTLELLKKLTNEEFLSKARLVGGTALALQYCTLQIYTPHFYVI